jgi:salicylate hydroxylase
MAVEDGAVLATLLEDCKTRSEIPMVLQVYDAIRRPRVIKIKDWSHDMRYVVGCEDGPDQEDRDERMRCGFSDVHPIPYATPLYQDWIWGYNAVEEARRAWTKQTSKSQL